MRVIIIIMYIYHALNNALSAHTIHINLNTIFYRHVEHSPTKTIYFKYYMCNRVYCIHVSGHDPLTFSFRSFSFLIWPQLSKELKVVCWAGSIPFPPVSLQRQVVCLLLRPVFMCSFRGEPVSSNFFKACCSVVSIDVNNVCL